MRYRKSNEKGKNSQSYIATFDCRGLLFLGGTPGVMRYKTSNEKRKESQQYATSFDYLGLLLLVQSPANEVQLGPEGE
jgi:hypothetical protein